MEIDLTFAHNFTVNADVWLPASPTSIPLYYYPGASTNGGKDGVLLEIIPQDGTPWLAMFASGKYNNLSGVYGCPNGHSICLICNGKCYFVRADDPQQWRERVEPVLEVRLVPDRNIMILRTYTTLIAYGAHGFLWQTKSIPHREFTIETIEGNTMRAKTLTIVRGQQKPTWDYVDYEVDLITGESQGEVGW